MFEPHTLTNEDLSSDSHILRIEVRVDGVLKEVFEFNTGDHEDPINFYWLFISSVSRSICRSFKERFSK